MHFADAVSVLLFSNQTHLLQLYPLINQKIQDIPTSIYFCTSALSTFILWGVTCQVAFDNPIEVFLKRTLSQAKHETISESEAIEKKGELLDLMNETVLSNNLLLGEMKDLIFNIRAEVKEISHIKNCADTIKAEMAHLKKELRRLEEMKYLKNVQAAGLVDKSLLEER